MYPIIIPINNEPEKCPKCGKVEDIKRTCRHCDYEYKEDNSIGFLCAFLGISSLVIWIGGLFALAMFTLAQESWIIGAVAFLWFTVPIALLISLESK